MVVLSVVKYGDEVLTQQATVVNTFDESLRQLATDLLDTMNAANGAGMAANQVGVREPRAPPQPTAPGAPPRACWLGAG